MHKFDVIAEVDYQGVKHKLDAIEYARYLELLENAKGETVEDIENHEQWITYNFLMDAGIFVSQPMLPNPEVDGDQPYQGKESPTKLLNPEVLESAKQVFEAPPKYESNFSVREDPWTQEKIYREAEKQLKTQQQLIEYNQKLFRREMELEYARKLANKKKIPRHIGGFDFKMYNKDGSELSLLDLAKFVGVLLFVAWFCYVVF